MKLAFTAKEKNINSQLEPTFEKCKYFIIIDTLKPKEIEVLLNPNFEAIDCAGILSSQFLINQGIDLIVTNNCRNNTRKLLQTAGVKILYEDADQIKNIIYKSIFYINKKLQMA